MAGVREMRYTFNACTLLASLDMRGFSPTALEVLAFTFDGCSALTTILVDASWVLPSGCGGGMTFYGCTRLDGKVGYLTAR